MLAGLLNTPEQLDEYAERILEAAEQQFMEFGLRRTSLDRIAQAAGVSRVTLFRRFTSRDVLLSAVVARAVGRFIAEFDAELAGMEMSEERIVRGVVTAARLLASDSLLRRLLVTDPDAVLPLLSIDGGVFFGLSRAYVADHLLRAREAGMAIKGDPNMLAEIFVRLAHSLLLYPSGALVDDEARLVEFTRSNILPMVLSRAV
ncbi:TetR/AcrR family transcriptional regulator [Mycobacterium sp. IS-3022]|uniref:TetR/AcrR family transcriptional regulator n=1 Tax=Mycobacterium sp. IS-3022 TaxID=1772277 RepID=UPI001561AB37|nr:TetR/AcrR family transcriptional regulator [Mycobacterium sp. IS-3022]